MNLVNTILKNSIFFKGALSLRSRSNEPETKPESVDSVSQIACWSRWAAPDTDRTSHVSLAVGLLYVPEM